jgi:hypothetical protein
MTASSANFVGFFRIELSFYGFGANFKPGEPRFEANGAAELSSEAISSIERSSVGIQRQ